MHEVMQYSVTGKTTVTTFSYVATKCHASESQTSDCFICTISVTPSYWGLDHLHALPPHLGDNGRDVHHILLGSLLQSCVNGNQCASPPNTSTAGRQPPPQ